MLPKGIIDKIEANVSKPCFWKILSPGQNWKSKSMRIIPAEFVGSTPGAFEHRIVISDQWEDSWQLWLERDKDDLFMIKEDWEEFVDDNHLGPNDNLFFIHDDTMYLEVRIFKNNGDEIMDVPQPETESLHQKSHKKTTTASTSTSASANGGTNDVEQYLLNPKNPYFVKRLTKKNDVLVIIGDSRYVPKPVIEKYELKFGLPGSTMVYLLPEGKMDGVTKIYGASRSPCFNGWLALCRECNLKTGDSVVCELERSEGLVSAVRVHFINK